jgi:SAM-dependent methyltransferase
MRMKSILKKIKRSFNSMIPFASRTEVNALYAMLYEVMHDRSNVPDVLYNQTRRAFGKQWGELPDGEYMLSDEWFRNSVDRIITEEETQIKREWFQGKRILDAGCGGGRWSYGFAKLGANLTCVDINDEALLRTKEALSSFDIEKTFIRTSLENINDVIKEGNFDLVWSWGVLHHCQNFNLALANVSNLVRPGGILYTYLYGRESMLHDEDIDLFKKRIAYNFLLDDEEKYEFLLRKAKGSVGIHQLHDQLAPLMNRRLTEKEVVEKLRTSGYSRVDRVNGSTELFLRAFKDGPEFPVAMLLPRKLPPYWFQNHGAGN